MKIITGNLEEILTKSYIDGIIDAIEIVSKWKGLGLHPSIIDSILRDLNAILTAAQNEHQMVLLDITMEDKKSRESQDIINKIDEQLDYIQSFE